MVQELGHRLKLARLNLDLTQTQVAQRSGGFYPDFTDSLIE